MLHEVQHGQLIGDEQLALEPALEGDAQADQTATSAKFESLFRRDRQSAYSRLLGKCNQGGIKRSGVVRDIHPRRLELIPTVAQQVLPHHHARRPRLTTTSSPYILV